MVPADIQATRPLAARPRAAMMPQPPSSAQNSMRISRFDRRTIYLPAEIPSPAQTGSRRYEASRPATSEAQRFKQARSRYAAETASYFPKIRESTIARDKREKQLALSKQIRQGWREFPGLCKLSSNQYNQDTAASLSTKPLSTLDQDGMAAMRLAFEKHGHLGEMEFISEMLYALNAHTFEWEKQVSLTHEFNSLYRQADLHAEGFLTWEDFSSTLFKSSDGLSREEELTSQRLSCQADALNMPAELQGMYYFADVNRVFLHDGRNKNFRLLDAVNDTIVSEFNAHSRGGSILDAAYSPVGRYVITASTSPVITLYDVDELQIRQQIPTEAAQIALELKRDPTTSRLFSSCTNGQVHVWNLETLSCAHSFFSKGHEVMTDIAVVDNTSHVATSCMDGKIYVLDLHLERIGKALAGHEKGVTMLKYSAHKGYLVSGGLDQCLHLWNPHVERKIGSLKGHRHQLIGLDVIPDTPHVVSADESGLIKIWDLRKFSPVQTFKREVYVKDHTLPRTLARPMRSMCYISSRKRIAVAHSSIFFVELNNDEEFCQNDEEVRVKPTLRPPEKSNLGGYVCPSLEERSKPLAVVFNLPSWSIVVVTPRLIKFWAIDSGDLIHQQKLSLKVDMTCVSFVKDQHSCFVGAEDGTIARVMLPHGAVILSKRLHSAEIAAVRWVDVSKLVVSSSFDGTVLISRSTNLEILHSLNHWNGIQNISHKVAVSCDEQGNAFPQDPIESQREVTEFKRLFNSADYAQTGKITVRKADEILETAFPGVNRAQNSTAAKKAFVGRESVTLTAFIKKARFRIKEIQRSSASCSGNAGTDAVTIDIHSKLQHLVTVSPFDGTFCVWKLKGGTVVASGVATKPLFEGESRTGCAYEGFNRLKPALVGQVVYLDPYPYFVLVEEEYLCQLSIWSSTAILPVFPYGHQRILNLPNGHSFESEHGENQHGSNLPNSQGNGIMCAVAWIFDEKSHTHVLCVGDDQGYVSIYDFNELFEKIEAMQKFPHAPPSRLDCGAKPCTSDNLLPSSLVNLRSRWLIRKGDPIRAFCVIQASESSPGSPPVIAITRESGATSFFTLEGDCVGDLTDRSIPWQLNVSSRNSSVSSHMYATKILQDMKSQKRINQRRQSHTKQEWVRNTSLTVKEEGCHKKSEDYAKQRPGLSRFLAVAKQL